MTKICQNTYFGGQNAENSCQKVFKTPFSRVLIILLSSASDSPSNFGLKKCINSSLENLDFLTFWTCFVFLRIAHFGSKVLKIPNFFTCFCSNSSRKFQKQLKRISNESHDPGEHFWSPIYIYWGTFVEVTAQKISEFLIFADFRGPRTCAFFGCSKIQKRKTRPEGRLFGKISISCFFAKIVLWSPLNNLRP